MTPLPKFQYSSIQEIITKPCNVLGPVLCTGVPPGGGGAVSRRQFTHSPHSSVKACGCLFSSPGMWVWRKLRGRDVMDVPGTRGAEILSSL